MLISCSPSTDATRIIPTDSGYRRSQHRIPAALEANALGQRTSVKQNGSAFADYYDSGNTSTPIFQTFAYDARGQLTAAPTYLGSAKNEGQKLPSRQHEFAYDNIGNRAWSNRVGTGKSADADTYTANALNQYLSRDNKKIPVSGTVDRDATVVVTPRATPTAAPRQGRYWSDELAVANGPLSPATVGTPWRAPLSIYYSFASYPGGQDVVRLDTRVAQIPGNPQAMTYDADGNVTNDGIWSYSWDGENRLIRLTTVAAASTGYPQITLTFRYDYLGRRVEKLVIDNASNRLLTGRRFLYDGWNLVAEYALNPQLSTLSLFRSYTWGLDITRTLTDAGGVGALLQIADHRSGKTYFPAYDGNGNITALVNSSTGAVAAAYEYSPFGEPLRADAPDSVVADQPFRFSTKYTDSETGLVYYGRRYYDPKCGRFPSRDPIDEKGGKNLYAIVWNNPINKWDYLGMCGGPGQAPCQMAPFVVGASRLPSFGGGGYPGGGWDTGFDYGGWNTGYDGGGGFDQDANQSAIERQIHRALNGCDGLQQAINKAQAAVASYDDTSAPPGSHRASSDELSNLPQDVRDKMKMSNGLSISVFVNDNGGYTVAFRGTEGLSGQDWRTNVGNALGFVTGQYSNAIDFAIAFKDAYGSTGIDFVGHSLGGGLASAAAMRTGLTATTFNAASVGRGIIRKAKLDTANADSLITNYYNTFDPLTLGQVATPIRNAGGAQVHVPMVGLSTSGHSSDSIVTNMRADYGKRGCNN